MFVLCCDARLGDVGRPTQVMTHSYDLEELKPEFLPPSEADSGPAILDLNPESSRGSGSAAATSTATHNGNHFYNTSGSNKRQQLSRTNDNNTPLKIHNDGVSSQSLPPATTTGGDDAFHGYDNTFPSINNNSTKLSNTNPFASNSNPYYGNVNVVSPVTTSGQGSNVGSGLVVSISNLIDLSNSGGAGGAVSNTADTTLTPPPQYWQ